MKDNSIIIIGNGGFAKEASFIIEKLGYKIVGNVFKSDEKIHFISKSERKLINKENYFVKKSKSFFIAIGDPYLRSKLYSTYSNLGAKFPFIVDLRSSVISVNLLEGSIVYPNSVIMPNTKIGRFVLINSGVTIGHDCCIHDFVTISPGVNIAGNVNIGEGAYLGIGACVKENISIGKNAMIGAGSVVIKDVSPESINYGNPCIPVKK